MGGCGAARIVATVALATFAIIGCGTSKSSDGGNPGQGGTAGQAIAGSSGAGSGGRADGGARAGEQAGSAASLAGISGRGATSGNGGSGSSGAGAGAGAGASGSGAAGGSIGNAGAAGEGAGGAGAGRGGTAASIDCTGTFGEPRVVFDPEATQLFSPTLTADELELVYAAGDGRTLQFFHSKRASKAADFGPGEPLPELDAACVTADSRTADLTSDGLRAYLVCYGTGHQPELHVAARPALGAPFVLDPMIYGSVGPSAGIAPGELTLYSSGFQPGQDPGLVFERASTSEPFGDAKAIPGLEGVLLLTPDVSADGLSLFGSLDGTVVVATRPTVHDAYSAAAPIVPLPPAGQWISATISEDCRSLYAVLQATHVVLEVFER